MILLYSVVDSYALASLEGLLLLKNAEVCQCPAIWIYCVERVNTTLTLLLLLCRIWSYICLLPHHMEFLPTNFFCGAFLY
jgi:hypothetical protein